jgi:hypothetical protein
MANPVLRNGLASPHSVYSTYTSKAHAFGELGFLGDRTFRYARLTDTTAIGSNKLAQQTPPLANHVTETGALTGFTLGRSTFTAVLGATAAYVNEYEDGYIKIESSTLGPGQIYKLRGHAAVASAGTATFDLYDPVIVTPTGTVTWSLIHNPYGAIVISPTTITAPAAGGTLVDWAAASTSAPLFGWLQVGGQGSCLIDTSDQVAGSGMIQSGATAGALGVAVETDIKQRIAIATEAMTTNSVYVSVDWKIG